MDLTRPMTVVTPTVDGDVLAALAQADAWFTTGRLHRVIGRHSEDGIRRVLRRLTQQGIVDSQDGGNAVLYRLNRDHLAAAPIMQLAQLRTVLIKRMCDSMASWSVPAKVGALFGSAARGTMTTESDIDIFLVRPSELAEDVTWSTQVLGLSQDVKRWTGNDARILQLDAEQVEKHPMDEPVLQDVLRDGIPLAGDLEWIARLMTLERLRV